MILVASLAKNLEYHSRTKHIKLDVHFVRDKVLANVLDVRYIPTEEQIVDVLTKAITFPQFNYLRSKLNVKERTLRGC